jgi:hypothetical protein
VNTVVRGGGDILPRLGKAVVCVAASIPGGRPRADAYD